MNRPQMIDYEPVKRPRIRGRSRRIIVSLLLVLGVQTWLIFAGRGGAYWGRNVQLLLLLIVAGLSLVPPVYRNVTRVVLRLRRASNLTVRLMALVLAVGSSVYLYLDARYQQRTFAPKYHDEFSYIIQSRHIAQLRLWEPAHPLADFFDSFQLIADPVYGSIYFPGAAIMYAPGVWLGLPPWLMPLMLAGVLAGLVFLIIAELLDPVWAFVAALMMIANPIFRLQALMVMAEIPAMLLTLAMIFAWLRWRERFGLGWAVLIGVCAGWCAITRPLDALCAAIPVGSAMLLASRRGWGAGKWSLVLVVVGALPFLALQAGFNRYLTSSFFQTPFGMYADRYFPQTSYGFHRFDPAIRPKSALPQKQAYYDNVAIPFIKSHAPKELIFNWGDSRVRNAVVANVPMWLMLVLLPAGLLGVFEDRRRIVLWTMLPLFLVLYFFYTFFLAHYVLIVCAAVVLTVLAGADVVVRTFHRARPILLTFFVLALATLSVSELAEFNRLQRDEWFEATQLRKIDRALASLERTPAIVLFRFGGDANSEEEPVYNVDVVWPDLAPVIRAHDLGERNIELFRYYAQRQPDRAVYVYDRADDSLKYLGMVRELAKPGPL